jgi:hypothetical protein
LLSLASAFFTQAATLLRFAKQTGNPKPGNPKLAAVLLDKAARLKTFRSRTCSFRKFPTWSGKRDLRRLSPLTAARVVSEHEVLSAGLRPDDQVTIL